MQTLDKVITPWPAQEIAFYKPDHGERGRALRGQVDAGYSHIVREVQATGRQLGLHQPLNERDITQVIDHAEREFKILERCGISIPDHDWHVFQDTAWGAHRLLARVAVIEGQVASAARDLVNDEYYYGDGECDGSVSIIEQRAFWSNVYQRIDSYHRTKDSGARLNDIRYLYQYMLGHPRAEGGEGVDRLFLVDIEPRF